MIVTSDDEIKAALLEKLGQRHYAIPTTDTAFKHMLSVSSGNDSSIVISLLNCFIPAFRGDPIVSVSEAPVAIPALTQPGEKQTFMDLNVVSSQGTHYIIEMQAKRHIMFDERALFYACSTYSRQLSELDLGQTNWYTNLKPVIALQILDYDTNRIRGIRASVPDTLVERVANNPLPEGQFIKHYILQDPSSGQKIDYLQMIQVELLRADNKSLFPPQENFTLMDWWLSIFRCADQYTSKEVDRFYREEKTMPTEIYNALRRLDLQQWNPGETREYKENFIDRELFESTLEAERKIGRQSANRESIARMRGMSMTDDVIC